MIAWLVVLIRLSLKFVEWLVGACKAVVGYDEFVRVAQATKTKKFQIAEIIHVVAKIGIVVGEGVLNPILKVLRGGAEENICFYYIKYLYAFNIRLSFPVCMSMAENCLICESEVESDLCNVGKKGIIGLVKASVLRKDRKQKGFRDEANGFVHNSCRREYVRSDSIKRFLRDTFSNEPSTSRDTSPLRSGQMKFPSKEMLDVHKMKGFQKQWKKYMIVLKGLIIANTLWTSCWNRLLQGNRM